MYDRQTRQELNALSKEVFGASSRWQKLVNKGYSKLLTEEVEETIPADENGENGGIQMIAKPVLRKDGATQSTLEHHTVDSVKELMLSLKTKRDAYIARLVEMQEKQIAAQKAAQEAEELSKKVQEVSGSAGL